MSSTEKLYEAIYRPEIGHSQLVIVKDGYIRHYNGLINSRLITPRSEV